MPRFWAYVKSSFQRHRRDPRRPFQENCFQISPLAHRLGWWHAICDAWRRIDPTLPRKKTCERA